MTSVAAPTSTRCASDQESERKEARWSVPSSERARSKQAPVSWTSLVAEYGCLLETCLCLNGKSINKDVYSIPFEWRGLQDSFRVTVLTRNTPLADQSSTIVSIRWTLEPVLSVLYIGPKRMDRHFCISSAFPGSKDIHEGVVTNIRRGMSLASMQRKTKDPTIQSLHVWSGTDCSQIAVDLSRAFGIRRLVLQDASSYWMMDHKSKTSGFVLSRGVRLWVGKSLHYASYGWSVALPRIRRRYRQFALEASHHTTRDVVVMLSHLKNERWIRQTFPILVTLAASTHPADIKTWYKWSTDEYARFWMWWTNQPNKTRHWYHPEWLASSRVLRWLKDVGSTITVVMETWIGSFR
jgi:hypothetical protein